MPLTNPNKIVTEERLSEFYGQILPYMGGMPDVLANKFSKGDLYSTDEKMIGVWVDGKPLYQKTIQMSYTQNWDYAHPYSEIGLANLSYVQRKGTVKFHYAYGGDNFWYDEHYHSSSDWAGSTFGLTDFRIGASQDASRISEVIFTLQYTKTTDSAISIGSDTDYSTDEKIVGTWVDGKPLYSRTYITTLSLADKRTWKAIGSVGDITVRKKDSLYLSSNGSNFGNQDDGSAGNTATSPSMYTSVGLKIENNTLKAYTVTLDDSFYPIQYNVTLLYTKNTD